MIPLQINKLSPVNPYEPLGRRHQSIISLRCQPLVCLLSSHSIVCSELHFIYTIQLPFSDPYILLNLQSVSEPAYKISNKLKDNQNGESPTNLFEDRTIRYTQNAHYGPFVNTVANCSRTLTNSYQLFLKIKFY